MQGIYLDELGLNFVKTCLQTYLGQVYFFGIFIACIFLFIIRKKTSLKQISYYVLFLFATIFNPFLVKWFFGYFHQDEVYYRFFWLLPINLIVAYLMVYVLFKVRGICKQLIVCFLLGCCILFMGSPVVYPSTLINIPDNLYKVPDDVLEISEYIHQSSDSENPLVAVAPDLLMTIRQYDPSITLTLERNRVLCWQGSPLFQSLTENGSYQAQRPIMDVIYAGDISNPTAFLKSIDITQTQYLVYSKDIDISSFLESLGYQYINETTNYYIFKIPQN